MPKFDKLGNKCKWEEQNFGTGRYLNGEQPIICRIDGKNFHNFTKGLTKPFDPHLVDLMINTTKFLVAESAAVWGFTQSDEITMCLLAESPGSQVFFDGKTQKIVSVLASLTTAYFNANKDWLPIKQREKLATFDARAFNVANLKAAVRQYVWRENDATRNSLSMLAQSHFSHSDLQNKKRSDLNELLHSKNVNWNDLPSKYKRGTIVRRTKRRRTYSAEEIKGLPANHEARRNPDLIVERSSIEAVDLPPFSRVANKVGVLFYGEEVILKEDVIHDQD